jgi:hypothetical protein
MEYNGNVIKKVMASNPTRSWFLDEGRAKE